MRLCGTYRGDGQDGSLLIAAKKYIFGDAIVFAVCRDDECVEIELRVKVDTRLVVHSSVNAENTLSPESQLPLIGAKIAVVRLDEKASATCRGFGLSRATIVDHSALVRTIPGTPLLQKTFVKSMPDTHASEFCPTVRTDQGFDAHHRTAVRVSYARIFYTIWRFADNGCARDQLNRRLDSNPATPWTQNRRTSETEKDQQ